MAIPTITVTGKIIDPSGNGVTGGVIRIRLSNPGVVQDDVTFEDQKVHGQQTVQIGATGVVSFTLVPNSLIIPAGTTYQVTFVLANGFTWTEYWSISASPATQEIGDITVVSPTVLNQAFQLPALGSLPTASGSSRRQFWYVEGGTNVEDQLYICMKNADGTFSYQLITSGSPV